MSGRRPVLVGALAAALMLAGCTGGQEPEPPPPPAPNGSASPSPSPSRTSSSDVGDVTPQVLSDEIFAAAGSDEEALGTVTGPVELGEETTLDVLEVRALVGGGTLVRLRMSSATAYQVGLGTFADDRFGTVYFVRDVHLDDPASGTRLLPLQFEDYRQACVCPYKPLELGPEPTLLTAVFPELPEGATSVDVGLGGGTPLVVSGVPVA